MVYRYDQPPRRGSRLLGPAAADKKEWWQA